MIASERKYVGRFGKCRWILVATAMLALPAVWSLRQIHLENQVENWLPANDPQAKTLRWYQDQFPQEERILVSWDGSSLKDPRVAQFVRTLTAATDKAGNRHGGLEQVRDVVAPQHLLERMVRAGVRPDEALRRLRGVLIGAGPDAPVAVSLTLSEKGQADKAGTVRALRQAAQEAGIKEGTLHLAGPSLVGIALNRSVVDAAWNHDVPGFALHKRSVLLLSAAVGVLLAVFMLRSIRLAGVVLFVAFYTTLLAVALVPVSGGSMNMVLVVMPPLLVVLTISAAIHVVNYWKHAAEEDRYTAAARATKMARLPCALASLTTAVGLLSLVTSSLTPVRDFGLYSAVGCVIGLAMVLLGLPALLHLSPPQSPRTASASLSIWHNWGQFVSRHRTLVMIASLAFFCIATYGLRWFRTDIRVIRNFPEDSQIVKDFRFFEEQVGGVVPVETIVRFEARARDQLHFLERMELVRKLEMELRSIPEISGTFSLADLVPNDTLGARDAGARPRSPEPTFAQDLERQIRRVTAPVAQAFLTTADEASDLHTTGDRALNKAGDDLWRITAYAGLLSDVSYADLTRDLHERAASVLDDHPGTGHVVTGIVPVFERAQEAVLESLVRSFGLAFAVIAVVMMIVLKNPLAGMIAMLPNLLPIGIVFGLVSWSGVWIDIGTMITAAIALGIAVDGTLHLLTWFRGGIARGLTRRDAVVRALTHTGPAMSQTSIVVALGMLMLSFSDLLLISRFGWLMAALIATALVADIVFLPALLAGPLGHLLQKALLPEVGGQSKAMAVPAHRTTEAAV